MANKSLKYSKTLAAFICEKVEEGISVRELCKKYHNHPEFPIVDETQIYRWKKKYPEFKIQLDDAYKIFFYKKIDELEELSTAKFPADLDKMELNAEINRRRLRIDTLKFILAKLAPKLVPDLKDDKSQVNIALPTINIVRYVGKEEKLVQIPGPDNKGE